MEKGEFIQEKLSLEDLNEENQFLYDSYDNEYLHLILENKNGVPKIINEKKPNHTEDYIDVSSFVDQDDIVTELNQLDESERIKNDNLLIESLQKNKNLTNNKENCIISNQIDESKYLYL